MIGGEDIGPYWRQRHAEVAELARRLQEHIPELAFSVKRDGYVIEVEQFMDHSRARSLLDRLDHWAEAERKREGDGS